MRRLSRKRIAQVICAYALRVAPRHRTSLARAMVAELDHVSDRDVLGFAAGCACCAAGWWLATSEGVVRSTRFVISAGTAALAVAGLASAFRVWTGGAQDVAWALASIAAFYVVAAVLALLSGLKAVALYAGAGLVLNTLALLLQFAVPSGAELHEDFLQALVIEEYGILAMLIGLTSGAQWVARRLKAAH